jgi:hypothetical protein
MLKIGTEDNLADVGTRGHTKNKLQKPIDLNSPIAYDVEEYPETIARRVRDEQRRLVLR